jgi:DNA ligase-1
MKPMKAEGLMDREGVIHLDKVKFPKLVSPKFDGNRCYVENGEAKSSTGKPIRNEHIREGLSMRLLDGFDGELIIGKPNASDVRRATSSGVGTYTGRPDFTFHVFDNFLVDDKFERRLERLKECIDVSMHPRVRFVKHKWVNSLADLIAYENQVLADGYEGVVLRCPYAPYKEGRATMKQNWALKLKRFVDAEARVIGFYERMHNDNEATTNELGYTSRSSHKENKRGAGDLGGLEVEDIKTGVQFRVGTGFDAMARSVLWGDRDALIGRILTYKHFPIGAKDKPNLPTFIAFRDADDIGD